MWCARLVTSLSLRGKPATYSCQWLPRGAGSTSHYPQQVIRSEPALPRWQGSDSGGFDEVPLGSPPLKPASADSNGGPPHLEKVVHSLKAYSKAEGGPQDTAAREASQLRAENASLKQRLSAVENVREHHCYCPCSRLHAVQHALSWRNATYFPQSDHWQATLSAVRICMQ